MLLLDCMRSIRPHVRWGGCHHGIAIDHWFVLWKKLNKIRDYSMVIILWNDFPHWREQTRDYCLSWDLTFMNQLYSLNADFFKFFLIYKFFSVLIFESFVYCLCALQLATSEPWPKSAGIFSSSLVGLMKTNALENRWTSNWISTLVVLPD